MTVDGAPYGGTDPVLPDGVPDGVLAGKLSDDDFEQLYRTHVDDARRLATILVGAEHAEELVAESFARVLAQLRAGRGPITNFRSYLHVTIRNGFRDSLRATREAPVSDQPWLLDDAQPSVEELLEDLEPDTAASAFATLPEAWQQVLWHVEVEGRKPGEVADLLGMRARAVSSLAHRAREGLRRAYLDQHVVTQLAQVAVADCGWSRSRLSQYVRSDLSPRAEEKVASHLGECEACLAAYLQVERVNRKLAAYLFPIVLLGALPAGGQGILWLAGATGLAGGIAGPGGSTGSTGTASGGSGVTGVGSVAVAAAAVAAVAAVGIGGIALVRSQDSEPAASGTGAPASESSRGEPAGRPPPAEGSVLPVDEAATPDADTDIDTATDPADDPADDPPPARTPSPPTAASPDPADPTAAPARGPVVVVAAAPVATVIDACDTWGSLVLPTTRGVRYERTVGDGRSGPWTVVAAARDGFALRTGSTRTFSGDLGTFRACTRLVGVTAGPGLLPVLGPWDVKVDTEVEGPAPRDLEVRLALGARTSVDAAAMRGEGWTCRDAAGAPVGDTAQALLDPGDPVLPISCRADAATGRLPRLTVRLWDGLVMIDPPSGTVTLLADGVEVGSLPFPG